MRRFAILSTVLALWAGSAQAQDASVPAVTTASPGGYANPLKLDTDRYRRQQDARRTAPRQAARCSPDAMPAADKLRIQREYTRLSRAQGRSAADAWARQQGQRFRETLVARGICPAGNAALARTASTGTAATTNAGSRRAVRNRSGGKCTKTTMQARNIANPGGGAMSMIMVPVCVN